MFRNLAARLLAALLLAGGTRAILQLDVDSALIDATCLDQIEGTLHVVGNATDWPSTLVAGPDGFPPMLHVIFNHDDSLANGAVESLDLRVGEQTQTWTPEPFTVFYQSGPAFPVNGVYSAFAPCATAVGDPLAPADWGLLRLYPNPCNPLATVEFALPVAQAPRLRLYDLAGRLVRELDPGWLAAGTQRLVVDGSDLASGLYLVRLDVADGPARSARLLLLK